MALVSFVVWKHESRATAFRRAREERPIHKEGEV